VSYIIYINYLYKKLMLMAKLVRVDFCLYLQ